MTVSEAAPAQNTERATKPRAKRKAPGPPWRKGQSGNPGGRPKGIAAAAREAIGNDPRKLLEVFLTVAADGKAKPADRLRAAELYLDRAYGRAPAHAPVEGANPLGLGEVEQAIGATLDDLAQKRAAAAARGGEVPAVADRGAARADTA